MSFFTQVHAAVALGVSPSPSPAVVEPDADRVSPGLYGFLAVVFLGVAIFVIWKSMNKQIKRVDFDEDATTHR